MDIAGNALNELFGSFKSQQKVNFNHDKKCLISYIILGSFIAHNFAALSWFKSFLLR